MRPSLIAAVVLCFLFGTPAAFAQTVAIVNGKYITEADLKLAEREMGALNLAPDEKRRVLLEILIQRQILASAAEAAKLNAGDEYAQRVVYSRRNELQQLYLDKFARDAVTEDDAKRIYDEQTSGVASEEEVHARHILLEREADAKEVAQRIRAGADFSALAKSLSADAKTSRSGGDLGWNTKSELPEKLSAAVFALKKPGDVSAPVETSDGWHLVRLEERRMRTNPPFDEIKDTIMNLLKTTRAKEVAAELRGKAKIVYSDPSLELKAEAMTPEAPQEAKPPATPEPKPEAEAKAPEEDSVADAQTAAADVKTAAATAAAAPVTIPAAIEMPSTSKVTRWRHDGSLLKLLADGERIVMQFDVPRDDLAALGVKAGTPLLTGTRRSGTYSGEASTFSPQCGARAFAVKGQAAKDGNSFTVNGAMPVFGGACEVASEKDTALTFEYAGSGDR